MKTLIVTSLTVFAVAGVLMACTPRPAVVHPTENAQPAEGVLSAETAAAATPAASSWDGNSSLFIVGIGDDGEHGGGLLLGEIKHFRVTGFDRNQILVDGKPPGEDGPDQPGDEWGRWAAESAYAVPGQVLHLYHHKTGKHSGSATIHSVRYGFGELSGSHYLNIAVEPMGSVEPGQYYAISGLIHMNPRDVKTDVEIQAAEGQDCEYPHRRVVLTVDFDNDGAEEQIVWDITEVRRANDNEAAAMDNDGYENGDTGVEGGLIHIMRGETRLTSTEFWYDYDHANCAEYAYTYPYDPILLDISGDGIYELILSGGESHNSYLNIKHWVNGAFVETGAGYYFGD
ncbi:MAG: hypothetical protein FWC40_08930 [Proteobacteria bacterium]|nr:hypothetical protein [Pseudomonadota bacterium]